MALVPYSDDDASGDSTCSPVTSGSTVGAADAPDTRPKKIPRQGAGPPAGDANAWAAPSLVRQFPHQQGSYPTTVFIPVRTSEPQRAVLQSIYDELSVEVPSLHITGWSANSKAQHIKTVPLEHHVSVSRTVPLRYAQIDTLIAALQHQFRRLSRFTVSFGQLDILTNDNASRVFVSAMAVKGVTEICTIIERVNKTFRPHQLSMFHEDPRPHVSLAWDFYEHRSSVTAAVATVNSTVIKQLPEQHVFTAEVDRVCCQVGQRQYVLWQAA